jgi:hypothetical protein
MIYIFLMVVSSLVTGLLLYSLPATRSMKNAENVTLCKFILTIFEKYLHLKNLSVETSNHVMVIYCPEMALTLAVYCPAMP